MADVTLSSYSRIAIILVEALFYGEVRTAKRWGITTRTLRNYRQMLNENQELSEIFLDRRREFESRWADKIPAAILAGIDFIAEAAKQADYSADTIAAMASAIKILAEVGLTKEIIDARLLEVNRESDPQGRPILSAGPAGISTEEQ